ncbi:hypothetical protein GWI33_019317, partial [Rhynchophorus ferrugineus]
ENKELNNFNEELRMQLTKLISQQSIVTFKCNLCSKVFSSEVYLNSHMTRRHNNSGGIETDNIPQTDKLNMEIKELKERLNNTEKLLKQKDEQNKENTNPREKRDDTTGEILRNFEEFKKAVDVELNELKIKNSFYKESYDKLFDKLEQTRNEKEMMVKADNTTQTEEFTHRECQTNNSLTENKEPEDKKVEPKADDALETKISATLAHIEGQMEAFWTKMNEIKTVQIPQLSITAETAQVDDSQIMRIPQAKPRSKLTVATLSPKKNVEDLQYHIHQVEAELDVHANEHVDDASVEKLIKADNKVPDFKPVPKPILSVPKFVKQQAKIIEISESSSETNTGESSEESVEEPKNEAKASEGTRDDYRKEVEDLLVNKLKGIGVSEDWTGIPQETFEKSMKITKHQGTLLKRVYPNFNILKKTIEKKVDKLLVNTNSRNQIKKVDDVKQKLQNVIRLSCRTKPERTRSRNLGTSLQITNRALYDTDTDSDEGAIRTPESHNQHPIRRKYTGVINQLKRMHHTEQKEEERPASAVLSKKGDVQKGVLKSFPSAASLSKKKVIFDLRSETSQSEDEPVNPKFGGSTTSIASSILELEEADNDDVIDSDLKKNRNKNRNDSDLEVSDVI